MKWSRLLGLGVRLVVLVAVTAVGLWLACRGDREALAGLLILARWVWRRLPPGRHPAKRRRGRRR